MVPCHMAASLVCYFPPAGWCGRDEGLGVQAYTDVPLNMKCEWGKRGQASVSRLPRAEEAVPECQCGIRGLGGKSWLSPFSLHDPGQAS